MNREKPPIISGDSQFFGRPSDFPAQPVAYPFFAETITGKGFQDFFPTLPKNLAQPLAYWESKTNGMTQTISKKDFQKTVIDTTSLSLVQFTREWSGACQIMSPMFEEMAKAYRGQARFYTVDVEQEAGLHHEYGVLELPTILFFRQGRVIDHIAGLSPKNVMITKIENALNREIN